MKRRTPAARKTAAGDPTLDQIKLDDRNPNRGSKRGDEALAESIEKFGFIRSVALDGRFRPLAGNHVIKQAQARGAKVRYIRARPDELIAVVRADLDLESPHGRAAAMADNVTRDLSLAAGKGYDPAVLQRLVDEGLPTDGVLFPAELERLLRAHQPPATSEPNVEKADALLKKYGVKAGDVWTIGRHVILCGDGQKKSDLRRAIGDRPVPLIVTSPPYNQSIDKFKPSGMHKEGGAKSWVAKVERLAYTDNLPEADYQAGQRKGLAVWNEVLADHGSLFYNHKNRYRGKRVVSPLSWILDGPLALRQEIVWSRPGSVTQNARMFLPSDERIYWLYKGDDFFFDDTTEIKTFSTVWDIGLEANGQHAVGFPVELPRRCIVACSRPGDVVLDPYCGSGTTIVAAEQTGRAGVGVEILPRFVAVALDRLARLGLEPKRTR